MSKETTISSTTDWFEGKNVLTGNKASCRFHPCDDGSFFYTKGRYLPISLENSFPHRPNRSFRYASCIAVSDKITSVIKPEHMMATVYGSGIDNIIIELSDSICPRFDHGYSSIAKALNEMIVETSKDRTYLRVKKGLTETERTVNSTTKDDKIKITENLDFIIDYTASFEHKSVGIQNYRFHFSSKNYINEIADARGIFFLPFGSRLVIDSFLNRFHGITDYNSLLIGKKNDEKYANFNGSIDIHEKDLFVKHKIMDAIGVLALNGRRFKETEFSFYKTGHKFDIYAYRELLRRDCFEYCN